MPPIIAALPVIAAIAGIGAAGTGIGLELSNQPGAPKPTPPPTPAVIGADQNQIKAAVSQQDPNILSATSGLANPDYVAQISQLLAGTGGQTGSTGAARQAVNQVFGLNPSTITGGGGAPSSPQFTPAGTGTTPASDPNAPTNLSEFLQRFLYA
jgi:hypothetical protein